MTGHYNEKGLRAEVYATRILKQSFHEGKMWVLTNTN